MTPMREQYEPYPLLPLDTYRAILGYHPLAFWGLRIPSIAYNDTCNAIVPEYGWQDVDAGGREELKRAIISAQHILANYLGYAPAPRYVEQTISWPRYAQHGVWRYGDVDSNSRRISIQLAEGWIQALGIEQRTAIDTAAAIAWSDSDGDGYDDMFTISAATTVTDPDEIALYFAAADRLNGADVSEQWRIQPVTVSISGGTVTVTGKRWLVARPVLYQGFAWNADGLNFTDNANFASTLAIYQRVTNSNGTTTATSQGVLTWESEVWPYALGCCNSCYATTNSTDPAATGSIVARVGVRLAEYGLVIPGAATYNSTTGIWCSSGSWTCRPPDRVTIRALAGYPTTGGVMNAELARITAHLAAAEMTRPICACDSRNTGNRELHHWQFDLARTAGVGDEQYGAISANDLDNPIGTRRGHVEAWQYIQRHQQMRAMSL